MSARPSSLRRFVRRTLVDATGASAPDRVRLTRAFDDLCGRLQDRLQPVFGSVAVEALFRRAVHLAAAEFPWLRGAGIESRPCPTEPIEKLEHLDAGTIEEGLATVLAYDIELLIGFVGEDLVLPLVQQAWDVEGVVDGPATEVEP
jgi:hypothetical protein